MTTKQTEQAIETWYKSRRLWGAFASAVAAGLIYFFPENQDTVLMMLEILATVAGIALPTWSWANPGACKK
jgi:hypothetical protein